VRSSRLLLVTLMSEDLVRLRKAITKPPETL
jgi:hypothetical protein